MPRKCSICFHEKRQCIDEALLSGQAFRKIGKRFGLSVTALFRHRTEHLTETLRSTQAADEALRSDNLIEYVRTLRGRTERLFDEASQILSEAKRVKDLKSALAAIRELTNVTREARGNAELLGRLSGELTQQNTPAQTIMVVMPYGIAPDPAERAPVIDIAWPARHSR